MTPSLSPSGSGGNECRGELLGQSRRGALTDAGRLALDAHLVACASCRLSRDVLVDFDEVDVVDIRDGARIRTLVDAARAAKAVSGGRARFAGSRAPRRLRAAAAAAALIICGGSASAAVWLWRHPAPTPGASRAITARADAPARVAARSPLSPPTLAAAPAEARRAPPPTARRRVAARSVVSDDAPSAAALLAEAGRARGEGQVDRAATLYRRLQREFPGTPEALVSAVPLGRLLLDGGAARPALAAFDGYLRDVPRGSLVAEALYGKGRALESLGDRDEERRTWARLVADHAGSAYVPHAQRRLATLR